MSEPVTSTTSNDENDVLDNQNSETEHTCACGETHTHRPGSPSHREECMSPKKFGDTCCCAGNIPNGNQHRCGHGPRCQ
jgi:hypothetical protein